MKQRLSLQLAAPLLAIAFALVVSGLILLATGFSPGRVLGVIVDDGFGRQRLVATVNRAAPYYISGIAVAIGFRMKLFNIGVEGQYKIAALVAAWAGASVSLPALLHVPFILLVAALAGSAYALVPGVLRAVRGVSEVISSIMLNYIAAGLASFLLLNYFRAPRGKYAATVTTVPLDASARLPSLNGALSTIGIELPPGSNLESYLFVAIVVGIIYRVVIWRTRFGFDLRATGSNPEAAGASGIDLKRMIIVAMAFSGAIAGLVGLNQVLGDAALYSDVSVINGLGFTGIAVALLGRNHPVGVAFGALLWAFMDTLQTPLSTAGLPKQITAILQGVTVLSVVIAYEVVRRIAVRQQAAELARDDADPGPPDEPSATAGREAVPV